MAHFRRYEDTPGVFELRPAYGSVCPGDYLDIEVRINVNDFFDHHGIWNKNLNGSFGIEVINYGVHWVRVVGVINSLRSK